MLINKIKNSFNKEVDEMNNIIFDEMNDIETFFNEKEMNRLEYFDAVVRNIVESVLVISLNRIKIKYVGGNEITKSI